MNMAMLLLCGPYLGPELFFYLLLFRVVPAATVVLFTWAVLHLVFGRRGRGFK
ncbi:MAG: hypothetical protein ACR2LZ_13665 [Pyrinomonadaceae bacterium]